MVIIVIIGVIAALGYYVSVKAHPLTKCRVFILNVRDFCYIYTYAHRRCRKCGGTGRKDRVGTRFVNKKE